MFSSGRPKAGNGNPGAKSVSIRDEWQEFRGLAMKFLPARYRGWLRHRLFTYFVFGYPAAVFLVLLLAVLGDAWLSAGVTDCTAPGPE